MNAGRIRIVLNAGYSTDLRAAPIIFSYMSVLLSLRERSLPVWINIRSTMSLMTFRNADGRWPFPNSDSDSWSNECQTEQQ